MLSLQCLTFVIADTDAHQISAFTAIFRAHPINPSGFLTGHPSGLYSEYRMNWTAFWTALTAIAAIGATIGAWYYAWLTNRLVVGQRESLYLDGQPVLSIARVDGRSVITNVGRGPALNIRVTTEDGSTIADFGALAVTATETFGQIPYSTDVSYFLYYQDLWSRWHRTRFMATPFTGNAHNMSYRLTFQPNVNATKIPQNVLKTVETRSALAFLNDET